MSGLETLPPDQRAVLQLILVQGRGYADLAALLKLDLDAVRSRARAGVDGLDAPGAEALDAAQRARIADYLLGQQDDGERIVTFAELADSPAPCRWAQELRAQLAGFARTELPEVPADATAAASANGRATSGASARAAAPAAPATPAAIPVEVPTSVPATTPVAASSPAATAALVAERPPPAPPSPPAPDAFGTSPDGPRPSSRLGGAVLLAGIVVLAIVLAIVLIGGRDDEPSSAGSTTTPTQTNAQTQPTRTTPQPAARIVAQVNLNATAAGGNAIGIGLVQRSGRTAAGGRGQLAIAIEAQRLPANGAQDIYAVWLQSTGGARFLGFVPRQVRAGGSFTVSAALPANARDFGTLLITREGTTAVPTSPGEQILSGALRLPA